MEERGSDGAHKRNNKSNSKYQINSNKIRTAKRRNVQLIHKIGTNNIQMQTLEISIDESACIAQT